jgi:hypothetical protein
VVTSIFQLKQTLDSLKHGKKVEVPIYNFVTHRRNDKTVSMYGANVLIFEGILAFHDKDILDMLDMKVFVDTDSDIRLTRRLTRDISQRGRDLKVIKKPFLTFWMPILRVFMNALIIHLKYSTLKPVYNNHSWDPKIMAVVDRWSLFRGHFRIKISNWDLKMFVVVDRWS